MQPIHVDSEDEELLAIAANLYRNGLFASGIGGQVSNDRNYARWFNQRFPMSEDLEVRNRSADAHPDHEATATVNGKWTIATARCTECDALGIAWSTNPDRATHHAWLHLADLPCPPHRRTNS